MSFVKTTPTKFIIGLTILLAVGYWVGWRTFWGRALRGISTVSVRNESGAPFQYVHVHLTDSHRRVINRHFEFVKPHRRVRVAVRTSDLYLQRVVCEQGSQFFTFDDGDIATTGEVLELVVDSAGKFSRAYD